MSRYIDNLSGEQYLVLARIVEPSAKSIGDSRIGEDGVSIDVESIVVMDGEECGIWDFYIFGDFDVEAYDTEEPDLDTIHSYRRQMLEWFGDGYARDYLLNC